MSDSSLKIIFSIVLGLLVIFSAIFSAAETAYSSISPAKLEARIRKKQKWSKLVKKHYNSFGWTLATILIANNVVNVAASSLTTYLISSLINTSATTSLISIAIVTPVIVIFGEIIPKMLAKKYSLGYLKKVVYLMEFMRLLFFPITFPLSKIAFLSKVTNTEKDIQNLLRIARSEGVIEANEATLAQRALELDSTIVNKVMVAKDKIIFIKNSGTIKEAKIKYSKTGHSRILVKKNNEYIGFLHLKDILMAKDNSKVVQFMKPIVYVTKSMLVSKALEELRKNSSHIAVVAPRKNSKIAIGLITIEDIIEEIVGEIYDEHDKIGNIREIAHFKYVSTGSAKMSRLSKMLNVKFENSDDMTVKQWIQSRINRVIKTGLKYEYKEKIVFKVIRNNNKKETLFEITKKIK